MRSKCHYMDEEQSMDSSENAVNSDPLAAEILLNRKKGGGCFPENGVR